MKRLLIVLALLAIPRSLQAQSCTITGTGTSLGNAAANLAAGTWCKLYAAGDPVAGPSWAAIHPGNGEGIFPYMYKFVWDHTHNRYVLYGAEHANGGPCNPPITDMQACADSVAVYLVYSDTNSDWTRLNTADGHYNGGFASAGLHAWGNFAGDPDTGDMYQHWNAAPGQSGINWQKLTYSTNLFSFLPNMTDTTADNLLGGLEWNPDAQGLVFFSGDFGVLNFFDKASQTYKVIGNQIPGSNTLNVAVWNPVWHEMLIGGGTATSAYGGNNSWVTSGDDGGNYFFILKYDIGAGPGTNVSSVTNGAGVTNGPWTISAIRKFPAGPFCAGLRMLVSNDSTYASISVDPVTGKYLILAQSHSGCNSNGTADLFYSYDSQADTFTQLATPPPLTLGVISHNGDVLISASGGQLASAATDSYGVTVYMNQVFGVGAETWLYKTAATDWTSRSTDSDVFLVNPFDSTPDLGTLGASATNAGIVKGAFVNGQASNDPCNSSGNPFLDGCPVIDTTQKADGAGSMHFTIPGTTNGVNPTASAGGQFFNNFSTNLLTQFGASQKFFIQYRQRMDSNYITNNWLPNGSGNGWKQDIIGLGSTATTTAASCSTMEVVIQNFGFRAYPGMYNSCGGSSSHVGFLGMVEPSTLGVGNQLEQNGRYNPYCYSVSGQPFPSQGNCVGYTASNWMTYEIEIDAGPRGAGGVLNTFNIAGTQPGAFSVINGVPIDINVNTHGPAGAIFNISSNGSNYVVSLADGGQGYPQGSGFTYKILGTRFPGGATPANDLTITNLTVSNNVAGGGAYNRGVITSFTCTACTATGTGSSTSVTTNNNPGDGTSLNGTAALFNVSWSGGTYTPSLTNGGRFYVPGSYSIDHSQLDGVHDLTFTVTAVDNTSTTRLSDEFVGSTITYWSALDGQPPQMINRISNWGLSADLPSVNAKFGNVWLLPYSTGRCDQTPPNPCDGHTYQAANTWYDDLLGSTDWIPFPLTNVQSPTPPPATGGTASRIRMRR